MNLPREEMAELRQLRYFITFAEELHFERAAERLQMEPTLLSRAMREMERIFGVRLFERCARSTKITCAGAAFLDYAKRLIILTDHATTSARPVASGHSEHLRIGVSDCMAFSRITEILARYAALNMDVSVSVSEIPQHQQINWIRDNLLDASISLDGSYRKGISSRPIARDAICAVIPGVHPLAQAETVLPADLANYSLILFSAESDLGAGRVVDDFVETFAKGHIAFRASSLSTMLTLVALGHGVGLVGSAQMTGLRRRDLVLRPIGGVIPAITTYVLHPSSGVSKRLSAFIDLATKYLITESTAELS
jgi:DNA-binding transcriptional LysR family regulator